MGVHGKHRKKAFYLVRLIKSAHGRDRKVVPVDHLVVGLVAQAACDLAGFQAHDQADIVGAVVNEPDTQACTVRAHEFHGRSHAEFPGYSGDPTGKKTLSAG